MSKKDKNLFNSVENANKTEKVKDKSTFKKIMKLVGWFLLTIVAVIVIGVFGTWVSGKFNPKKIYIQSLSINGVKEYVTISDNDKSFKTTVSFLPAEANQLVLTSKVITGSDLIESMPTVKAGEEFEIVFAKDSNGITKGGEIEIKFIDSSQSAITTLKVLIDVSLNSSYIDVSTNGVEIEEDSDKELKTNVLTSVQEESAHVIKIEATHDAMLNSYNGNWTDTANNSVAILNRLKKMILYYDETDASIRGFGQNGKLKIEEVMGDEKYYSIKFLSPLTTIEPFKLDVYIYKTYYMETLFSEPNIIDILEVLDDEKKIAPTSDNLNYVQINKFINDYVYNNSSVAVKNNFAKFYNKDTGLIELGFPGSQEKPAQFKQALQNILDYVLVGKRIMITVDNIEVSEIVISKSDPTVKLNVLNTLNYGINEINSNANESYLGVNLISAENADVEVLKNNLKKLDIFLCERTTDAITTANVYDYFKFDAYTYRKIENNKNEYFELTKSYKDGMAQWNLKTLSPTPNYSELYLVYRYRNNDVTSIIMGENETQTEFIFENDKWHTISSNGKQVYYPTELGTDGSTLFEQLNAELREVYSVAPLKIAYNSGSISFNTNANINNADLTTIVLNKKSNQNSATESQNVVYTYSPSTGVRSILNGSQGGVYYNYTNNNDVDYRRVFTKGFDNKSNVILKPDNAGVDMEYTMVKWFVPYNENIIDYTEGMNPQDYKYYIMPVLENIYNNNKDDDNNKHNPIPAKVRLKQVDSNAYFGSESTFFMEIGTDTFTIEALNAMVNDYKIPLYAAIIQTKLDGQPYFNSDLNDPDVVVPADDMKFSTAKEIRYHYVSATDTGVSNNPSGHFLRVDSYVSNLKFYISKNGTFEESAVANSIELGLDDIGYLFLSNMALDSDLKSDNSSIYNADNDIILNDAIDNLRNNTIALFNYYNAFINVNISNDEDRNYTVNTPEGANYPLENSYSIKHEGKDSATPLTFDNFKTNKYIKFEIVCNSVKTGVPTQELNYRYSYNVNVIVNTPPTSSGVNKFFTDVESSNVCLFILNGAQSS